MTSDSNSLVDVLNQLSGTPDLPLLFSLDGINIGNGYHVTEIKLADITSVDCGSGSDRWQEVIIQLLDGASAKPAMTCGKFRSIMNKAQASLKPANDSRLVFEYSPSNGTLQRLQVHTVSNQNDSRIIELGGTKAECKPFSRALANSAASYCKGISTATRSHGGGQSSGRRCC